MGYREALDALRDSWLNITSIAAMPGLPIAAREQLQLLTNRLVPLLDRDDGRRH